MRCRMHRIAVAAFLCSIFFLPEAWAGQCSECLIRAMADEGLSRGRIDAVCARADRYARSKRTAAFTPDKIRRDLAGIHVGPEAVVEVQSHEAGRFRAGARPSAGAPGNRSYDVCVPIPMGIVFDQTNMRDVRVLDVKTDKDKALLVVYVETVSGHAGKLRLQYEYVVDEWVLQQVENVSFKVH